MSDIASPVESPVSNSNGRFTKGGPGGPGRPRGSVTRGDPVMSRAVVLSLLKIGKLERRIRSIETELDRLKREKRPQRFIDRFRRFLRNR